MVFSMLLNCNVSLFVDFLVIFTSEARNLVQMREHRKMIYEDSEIINFPITPGCWFKPVITKVCKRIAKLKKGKTVVKSPGHV